MKKVLLICISIVMVFALSLTAFAAPENFVESPTGNGPAIDGFVPDDPDFSGSLVIIPFKDRESLSTEDQGAMEDAYDSITKADDLSDICSGLKNKADAMGIPTTDLAVKDLFNIDATAGGVTVNGGKFTITLDASSIKGFVGIMQYLNGEWIILDDAKIENGKLVFTTEELTTYAIVVDATKGAATSPQTGDPMYNVYAGVVAACTVGIMAVLFVVIKKKNYE